MHSHTVSLAGGGGQRPSPQPAQHRLAAVVPPWPGLVRAGRRAHPACSAWAAGKYLFLQYPYVSRALAPLMPVYNLYTSFPFLP